jgi:hypothetical protein
MSICLQSYEKSSAKQKNLFFFLLRPCIFGEATVMKKLVKNNVFLNYKANLTEIKAQIEKNENKNNSLTLLKMQEKLQKKRALYVF